MTQKILQRLVPHEASFERLRVWRTIGAILLYAAGAMSIVLPFATRARVGYWVPMLAGLLNYILIFAYYVVNVVTETFAYPAAARLRRVGFLDNSLGTKFAGREGSGYFTNDAIPIGPYKLLLNCFENCFFTYNIAREATWLTVGKNTIFAAIFLVIAYFGLKDSLIALPVVQILLSSVFITELIHQLNFLGKLNSLLERFRTLFHEKDKLLTDGNELRHAILLMLEYETTLAYNKAPLSDRIYKKMNGQLSTEWEELKKYYAIT